MKIAVQLESSINKENGDIFAVHHQQILISKGTADYWIIDSDLPADKLA